MVLLTNKLTDKLLIQTHIHIYTQHTNTRAHIYTRAHINTHAYTNTHNTHTHTPVRTHVHMYAIYPQ